MIDIVQPGAFKVDLDFSITNTICTDQTKYVLLDSYYAEESNNKHPSANRGLTKTVYEIHIKGTKCKDINPLSE